MPDPSKPPLASSGPERPAAPEPVFRDENYRKLWLSHTTSVVGSTFTFVALPLTAVTLLNASAIQMGALSAAHQFPRIGFALYLGSWVDQRAKQPVMLACQLISATALFSVPAAYFAGLLTMWQLYVVALVAGTSNMAFQFADRSFLPLLLKRDQLLEGNSKLQISGSVAQAGGPGLAGLLVQWLTAPFAIALDAISYLVSFLLLRKMKVAEPSGDGQARGRPWLHEVREGARFVFGHPLLRATTFSSFLATAGVSVINAVQILFMTENLSLGASSVGFVLSAGGAFSILGALACTRITQAIGVGRAIVVGTLVPAFGYCLFPFAESVAMPAVAMGLGFTIVGLFAPVYHINEITLRQTVSPSDLIGRVTSMRTFFAGGAGPIFALIGGGVGQAYGLRTALFLGVALFAAGLLFLAVLMRVRTLEDAAALTEQVTAQGPSQRGVVP
jgi:MFS family permease